MSLANTERRVVVETPPEYFHVYPLFGRKHVLVGLTCWCCPEEDPEEPNVVIHHEDN